MILAEKIMKLRKQNGWSQEELAVKLNISRQSVSKWESGTSIPDLDKILKLSQIFGVSTDYLLKDELEEETGNIEVVDVIDEDKDTQIRKVSLDEANQYMELVEQVSKRIAAGVVGCILSPALLILICGLAETKMISMTEDMAAGVGVTVLLLMIAGSVAILILGAMKLDKYEYLEKELLDLEYGISGIVQTKQDSFESIFKKCIASGVALCICCPVPLMIAAAFSASDIVFIFCVDILLLLVALAVYMFVWAGMINESYQKLLEEGDYTREKKLENKKNENLSKVYWCIVTAIYLGYSFVTMDWHRSWIIWPCAGVLFAAVCGITAMIRKK